MLKKLFIALLYFLCSIHIFSQIKPRLGILPYLGGIGGDGETIAQIFSMQHDILETFTVIPRSSVDAIIAEQNFQMSGYTDSDTIAKLGRLLNADFVVSGHIRRLGKSNLIITTIINVETFEQMAGDYHTYQNIEEIRDLLPAISKKMIAASQRNTSSLLKLAIAPFNIVNTGVNKEDAETLAEILAVEITNTGKYAVLPRTATMQTALQELRYQMSGYTAEEGAKALGRAINADFVLSAEARNLGNINMFTAQILHVEDGSLLTGDVRKYRIVDDGIILMAELALFLTDKKNAAAQISARNRELSRTALFGDISRLWSIGISAGTAFTAPWIIGTLHGTIAPLRYSFLEIGFDYGMVSGVEDVGYYSFYPFLHYALFVPFVKKGGWHIGTGGGYMIIELDYPEGAVSKITMAADLITGFNIGNIIDISYTLRTNFKTIENKISAGYTYRFIKGK